MNTTKYSYFCVLDDSVANLPLITYFQLLQCCLIYKLSNLTLDRTIDYLPIDFDTLPVPFQMLSNTTSSRVAKTTTSSSSSSSQRVHHMSSEMKASSMKSDLTELKSSISEMKNISSVNCFNSLRKSMEDLVDAVDSGGGGNGEPLVTFPDTPDPESSSAVSGVLLPPNGTLSSAASSSTTSTSEMKFMEQKRMKVVTDQFSAEKEVNCGEERRRVQTGEVTYQEQSAQQAMRARLEVDGVSAEKSLNMKQVGGVYNIFFLPI